MFEIVPFGVQLNEREIRTWAEAKCGVTSTASATLADSESENFLHEAFREGASDVIRLVGDGCYSSNAADLFALIAKGAQVGTEYVSVRDAVANCCIEFLAQGFADEQRLSDVLGDADISAVEARCLCASIAFTNSMADESRYTRQLDQLMNALKVRIERNDPFYRELAVVREAMR